MSITRADVTPNTNKAYVLGVFWLVSMFSFLDRQVLSVLMEPIKADLSLSDTQLGLLSGFAFGAFYAVFGLPLAVMVDRFNRRNLLSVSIFFWSLMTALCGMAGSFASLFFARAGVAVGEAGGSPSVASMISDYFSPEKRGRAFSIIAMAIPVSIMIGYMLGGYLNHLYGWRLTFVIIGAPGIALALLVLLTISEPVRGGSENRTTNVTAPPFLKSIGFLIRRPAYLAAIIAGAGVSMAAYGSGVWTPSFFIRVHGLSVAQAGALVGLMYGTAGITGALAGGFLADRLSTRFEDERWYFFVPAIALAFTIPCAAIAYLNPSLVFACLFFWLVIALMHMYGGPHGAMLQGLAGLRMRGVSTSFYNFMNNLLAVGVGTLFVGMVSDAFGAQHGPNALRMAIVTVITVGFGGAAIAFTLGAKHLRQNLALARES